MGDERKLSAVGAQQPSAKAPSGNSFTMAEAFDREAIADDEVDPSGSFLNVERSIRSVAFLLRSCSDDGTESIPGDLAAGLSSALGKCVLDLYHAKHALERRLKGQPG